MALSPSPDHTERRPRGVGRRTYLRALGAVGVVGAAGATPAAAAGTIGSPGISITTSGTWTLVADVVGTVEIDDIHDVTIDGNGYTISAIDEKFGIDARGVENLTLRNVNVTNATEAAIRIKHASSVRLGEPGTPLTLGGSPVGIECKHVTDFEAYVAPAGVEFGVKFVRCADGLLSGDGRVLTGFGHDALDLMRCSDLRIEDFDVSNVGNEGVDANKLTNCTFDRVHVSSVASDGYEISRSTGVNVANAVISHCRYTGVDVLKGSRLVNLVDCEISECRMYPVKYADDSSGTLFGANSFFDNGPSNGPLVLDDSAISAYP